MGAIEEAEGYARLRMWQEAWEILEAMPIGETANRRCWSARLMCCVGLGRWTLGEVMAEFLREGDENDRALAACFYHDHAAFLYHEGLADRAREALRRSIHIRPEEGLAISEDSRFPAGFYRIE